jgi:hypothetical protein
MNAFIKLFCILLGLACIPGAAGQTIFPDPPSFLNPNASVDSGDDHTPMIATDGEGTWAAVWSSYENIGGFAGADSDILVSTSTDNGTTWSAPLIVNSYGRVDSSSGIDRSPKIASDGDGGWVAIWASSEDVNGALGDDYDIFAARSEDNCVTWSTVTLLSSYGASDAQDDTSPAIATDGEGNWVAAWVSSVDLNGTAGTDNDVFVVTSTDHGISWSVPALLNSTGSTDTMDDDHVALRTDEKGNWVAAWESQHTLHGTAGLDWDIFVSKSSDNGISWSAAAMLNSNGTSDSGDDTYPAMTTDGLGNWVAVWQSDENLDGTAGTDRDLFFAVSGDGGMTWSTAALLNGNGRSDSGSDEFASIETDGNGVWMVSWASNEDLGGAEIDGDIFAAASSDNGRTWTPPLLFNEYGNTDRIPGTSVGTDSTPTIASDGCGNWVFAWASNHNLDETAGFDTDLLWATFSPASHTLAIPYYLDNAGIFVGSAVPGDGSASFIGIKNMSDEAATLVVTYSDVDGRNRTPGENRYELAAGSMVSWRPFADDPIEGDGDGRRIPNTGGAHPWGSVIIESNQAISGRFVVFDGVQGSTAMMFMPEGLGFNSLSVPFYLDSGSNYSEGAPPTNGSASFVAVRNMSNETVTLTLTYTGTDGSDQTPTENTYELGAHAVVTWRPFADDPVEGTEGQSVPNTSGVNSWGSILIEADGPIAGRLMTVNGLNQSTSIMALPENREE